MISIIICSRTQTIPVYLSENIKNTIGCAYELIVIDNSENQYSIFEAYNFGIQKSKSDLLCLLHDDIIIHTTGWGNILIDIFNENDNIGLLGVAGTKIKTEMPSGWWNCPNEYKEINILQHLKNKEVEKWDYGFTNGSISEVVAIDGVFMIMRKDERIHFNTRMKGFHNYDLNISLEYKIKEYIIVVTNSILIEHLSNGNLNESWYKSTMKLHKIYGAYLPLRTNDILSTINLKFFEFNNGKEFLDQILKFGYIRQVLKLWFQLILMNPYSKFHVIFLKKFIKFIYKSTKIFVKTGISKITKNLRSC
jgi:hypothetical protein